jgi:hypothetical protein
MRSDLIRQLWDTLSDVETETQLYLPGRCRSNEIGCTLNPEQVYLHQYPFQQSRRRPTLETMPVGSRRASVPLNVPSGTGLLVAAGPESARHRESLMGT